MWQFSLQILLKIEFPNFVLYNFKLYTFYWAFQIFIIIINIIIISIYTSSCSLHLVCLVTKNNMNLLKNKKSIF